MRKVKVSIDEIKPPVNEGGWTEQRTAVEILTSPLVGYHQAERKVRTFAPVMTCFSIDMPNSNMNVYRIEFPLGTRVEWYGSEFRVELKSGMILEDVTPKDPPGWKMIMGVKAWPSTTEDGRKCWRRKNGKFMCFGG